MCYANVPFGEQSSAACGRHCPSGRLRATDRGHAMVYLDPVSGNCIFSKMSACEMLPYSWAKQGMTVDSESALLCRRGQLVGQGMLPGLCSWKCRSEKGKVLILSS